MNKYITSGIFLAAGLGALDASAQSNVSFKGSDTLFDVTQAVLAACPGAAGLTYLGTGSGNGETAVNSLATLQNIAPMSRFFNGNSGTSVGAVCSADGASTTSSSNTPLVYTQTQVEQNAAGIVVGLDGVAVYGSKQTGAKATCNGPVLSKTIAWNAGTYLSYNGACATPASLESRSYSAGSYTFSDWTDVLRIVYGDLDHNGVLGNCGSDVRAAVVQNWGKLFQNGEDDANNCNTLTDTTGSSTCTQLRHAFRRDDYSGTTDTFNSLIGLATNGRFANNAIKSDPFCNSIQSNVAGTARFVGTLPTGVNDYTPDQRDRDPIRRCAAGTNNPVKGTTQPPTNVATEQAAGQTGKLGVVLPINPMSDVLKGGQSTAYPTVLCTATSITGQAPPVSLSATTGADVNSSAARCPNGDTQQFGVCRYPTAAVAAGPDANCIGAQAARPVSVDLNTVEGVGHGLADGRVYSTVVLLTDRSVSPPIAAIVRDLNNHKIVGAYAKIHSTRTMNLPDSSVSPCQQLDATGTIACLAQADRCSIGFAGRGGDVGFTDVAPMPLRNTLPLDANLLDFSYPMTRKLYLDQNIPAADIWGQEAAYEACYISSGKAAMTANGFLGVDPICEDFNETVLCPGAGANSTAGCDGKRALYPSITATTVCGNGAQEIYEECDTGASNHNTCVTGDTTICTTACRFKVCL